MKKLSQERADELRADGKTQIASVIKSVYRTTYYHINTIAEIMDNGGKWIPCWKGQCGNWHGPIGITGNQIDWTKTATTRDI